MEEWKPLVYGFDDVTAPAGSDAAGVFYDEFYTRSGGDCGHGLTLLHFSPQPNPSLSLEPSNTPNVSHEKW